MSGAPDRFARTAARRPAGRPPARRPAALPAAAVDPFRLPKRARDLAGRALAGLRERGYGAWLDARRPGVAAVLRLGLARGWVAAGEVDAAFGDPAPHEALYRLFVATLAAIPAWVEALARENALDPERMPAWRPFAGIDLAEWGGELHLLLVNRHLWMHAFDLGGLPPALAVAVAQTLDLLARDLASCCRARDLAGLWYDEAESAYRELRAQAPADPAARWAAAEAGEWADWFGWEDRAAFERWWELIGAYCAPEPPWLRRWLARPYPPNGAAAARRALRRLWRWRRAPGLARTPWFRWLRAATLALRRARRRWPQPPWTALAAEDDGEMEREPLACAQPFGFGEPWEAGLYDDYYESVACGGRDFAQALRCDPDSPALGDALEAFAIGQGLLIGACQADALARGVPFD